MEKEQFEIQVMDYLAGVLSAKEREQFESFLKDNPEYAKQYKELVETWKIVRTASTPEPSSQMDEVFFKMLSTAIEKEVAKPPKKSFAEVLSGLFKPQFAYGLLLLGIGLGIGYFMNSDSGTAPNEILVADEETEAVRQKLVLTLLEQPSANQRLQGVSEANKFNDVDEIVVKALLQTLNNDSNVNVRLAAIESLTNYVNHSVVRQGLVQSIPNQESPLVQITLANLMVALQEKASIEPFRQLLKEKELDTTVQKKIEKSIESII